MFDFRNKKCCSPSDIGVLQIALLPSCIYHSGIRTRNKPYQSLAELIVLNTGSDVATNTFIEQFFERFRWASHKRSAIAVKRNAKSLKLRIFHQQKYYNEKGKCTAVYNRWPAAYLTDFLVQWRSMTCSRDSVCIVLQQRKDDLMAVLNERQREAAEYVRDLRLKCEKVTELFNTVRRYFGAIIDMERKVDKYYVDTNKNDILIRVFEQKKKFLVAGNFGPAFETRQPADVPGVDHTRMQTLLK